MNHMLSIRGVTYAAVEFGSGESLLLLHGFTGSKAVFQPFREEWASHFRCIVPDLLGHGDSDAPLSPVRYGMAETLRDVLAILDTLEVKQTHVLGYSMGGRIALAFALTYPERVHRLVLEGASPGLRTDDGRTSRRASDEQLAQFIETEGVQAFVERWESIPLFASQRRLPEDVFLNQRAIRSQQRKEGLAGSLRGIGTGQQPSYWSRLHELRIPTLLVTGELDMKFTQINEQMAACMQDATHVVIQDAGHTPHIEKPSDFQRIVVEFLR
ncbi:2-succinyl-6-hydroxy-2,4-cyclohexadiene-1-carboxylate synthase [Alicyclobacillus dauci]|uniref:Putative 2-succinyl-6-hydroxy-2,4-cyclohexadiene-1-carboxylate synthase n=1 Tax=Alicyclobacillus dauci TaxID=1475485 RepID=A0ABY6Z8D3_9BACL|nr:2-succinyl-6-hydroxy-2,4-cyclohexadiene-1-carboxylate synthase [Alicyclobacillus dauci]WAH38793.1 2-succinyl-6-hydroxy-2,4-cyclohexadiene-1-carboxylate synthase [Alicyclobacillus dauci]